jgi:hypothetical protein
MGFKHDLTHPTRADFYWQVVGCWRGGAAAEMAVVSCLNPACDPTYVKAIWDIECCAQQAGLNLPHADASKDTFERPGGPGGGLPKKREDARGCRNSA